MLKRSVQRMYIHVDVMLPTHTTVTLPCRFFFLPTQSQIEDGGEALQVKQEITPHKRNLAN